jgi:formylglycine-generating enzyme required for sulfatase activity
MVMEEGYLQRKGYRLPTDAEWEYACRAGSVTSRPHGGGDDLLDHYGWYARNAPGRAVRVGSLKPNDLGMFDMLGNAWEWCHDAVAPYPAGPEDGEQPGAVLAAQERVLRGGGFSSATAELRSAHRWGFHPHVSFSQAGFRVARTLALDAEAPEKTLLLEKVAAPATRGGLGGGLRSTLIERRSSAGHPSAISGIEGDMP